MATLYKSIILLLLIVVSNPSIAQISGADSLKNELKSTESKKSKTDILLELSNLYNRQYPDSAINYSIQAYNISKELKDDTLIASSLNQIGNIYNNLGKSDVALQFFMRALTHAEKVNDLNKIARIKNNIGIVYYYQEDYDQTLIYFKDAVNMLISLGDTLGAIYGMNNIGGVYNSKGDQVKALEYFNRAYDLALSINNEPTQAVLLTGIGTVHGAFGMYDQGLREIKSALEIKRKGNNIGSILHSLKAIGQFYIKLEKPDSALIFLREMEKLSGEGGFVHMEKDCYLEISNALSAKGNYQSSLEYLHLHMALKDSLRKKESDEAIAEVQAKYNKVQDQREIELLKKNEEIRENELARQEAWNIILIGGGIIILIIAFLIYSRLRASKRQNRIISEQKKLVDTQNREILDSINYAKRIQQAMLKSEDHESANLPEHFVLFRPKDIVSGDFYWAIEKGDYFYMAVVDCTGHGVPGAFLTVLGTAFLNEIASRDEVISPAVILDDLRNRIINELSQSGEGENRDGMDISMIRIHLKDLSGEWAGAHNPLWIIRNGKEVIEEVKADKQPIGFSSIMNPFTNHEIQFQKGDLFYLFSDGYADQFGGPNVPLGQRGKKFKSRQLKELLLNNKSKSLNEQHDLLIQVFEDWRGDLEQVDDVCVIGMRL